MPHNPNEPLSICIENNYSSKIDNPIISFLLCFRWIANCDAAPGNWHQALYGLELKFEANYDCPLDVNMTLI